MENIDKLIIITSPNGPEFKEYWNLGESEHPVIKNGEKRGPFKVSGLSKSGRHERLKQVIDQNGYLVMLHLNNKEKLEQVSFEKNGQLIEFFIYYYSTLDESLNGDLWSIDKYKYSGPKEYLSCPFDKLRMDIINQADTSASVQEVINWVKKKVNRSNLLEAQLNTLHQCLTPEDAAKVAEVNNYDLIKNIVVTENITVDDFIHKYLAVENDCFSDTYLNRLTQLRDSLLKEEASAA